MSPPACPFCAIVAGEAKAAMIFEQEAVVGFLDARPVFPGHVLVVPRDHHETLADLPEDVVPTLFEAARQVAIAMPEALGADGAFVAVNDKVSQSVPHVHVHVVPRRRKDGLRGFFWPRQRYGSHDEMDEIARLLRDELTGRFTPKPSSRPVP
ncbi:MAG TPA: HIT domain-containing protein [Acidimicrobiales bacterium]|nr:HIT domain-containing protein [Acidimicrobiales bacterium]